MVETRYRWLRVIAVVLKVFAWIVAIGCLLGFVGLVIWGLVKQTPEAVPIGLILLVYAFFGFIYLYAGAEMIYVLLDMEANTRRSAELLERLGGGAESFSPPPVRPVL